jgi:hypothetical protein
MRWAGHVTQMGAKSFQKFFYEKPVGKRPLETHRHEWENNFKTGKHNVKLWSRLIWLRMGPSGTLLSARY